jgi:signal transduction histidine kinase
MALLALVQRIMGERNPEASLGDVCDRARAITGAAIAGIALVDEAWSRIERMVIAGLDDDLTARVTATLAIDPDRRRVLETRQPAVLVNSDPRGDPTALGLPPEHPPVHAVLLAPVASPTRVYGWFALVDKADGSPFGDFDQQVATMLGAHVGVAYENAQQMRQLVAQADALRAQEDDADFAMSIAQMGVSFRDVHSSEIQVSRALAHVLDLPPGARSITRKEFLSRVHPDDAPFVERAVADAVANRSGFELEYRFYTPSRGWRWLRSAGRVTSNREGEPARVFSSIIDVTERRSLEDQLHHAQKMEAIGQLAGGVAHDFNNILTAIGGYAQLLLESAVDLRQRRDIEEIIAAAERGATLTRRLLTFSRRQVLEAVVLDVNALVDDMGAMLRRIIGENIRLTTRLAPDLPHVRADRSQLEQVVLNLVVNARDAIEGSGAICVETAAVVVDQPSALARPALRPGSYVTITVSDTGCGMDEEIKTRLFEPFFTTKPRGQGTGLGLATVYGIVTQTGGSVGVTSEPGAGSTFTVYLPAVELTPVGAVRPPATRRVVPVQGAAGTILLVEDERPVRLLARRILERAGYTVVAASNLAEAEALASTLESIDLLLTDVIMPGGTGPELFRRLAAARPGLRVLFMSGYAEQDLVDRSTMAGAPFLEKPFTMQGLITKVRAVLDG